MAQLQVPDMKLIMSIAVAGFSVGFSEFFKECLRLPSDLAGDLRISRVLAMFGCGPTLATFAPLWSAKTAARQSLHWHTMTRVGLDSWKSWLIRDLRLKCRKRSAQPDVHSMPTRLAGAL